MGGHELANDIQIFSLKRWQRGLICSGIILVVMYVLEHVASEVRKIYNSFGVLERLREVVEYYDTKSLLGTEDEIFASSAF